MFESIKALPIEEQKKIEKRREYKRKLRELWDQRYASKNFTKIVQ